MIDISLVDETVNIENFKSFDLDRPCLFLGFAVKNEYDNQRLKISENYNPQRQIFAFEKDEEYRMIPLYGLFLELNETGKTLTNALINQQLKGNLNINEYEKLLDQHNLTCKDSYSYLNKNIYPIDFKHFTELTNDNLKEDGKILQHLLDIDEDKFDFQKFGAFKLLILV